MGCRCGNVNIAWLLWFRLKCAMCIKHSPTLWFHVEISYMAIPIVSYFKSAVILYLEHRSRQKYTVSWKFRSENKAELRKDGCLHHAMFYLNQSVMVTYWGGDRPCVYGVAKRRQAFEYKRHGTSTTRNASQNIWSLHTPLKNRQTPLAPHEMCGKTVVTTQLIYAETIRALANELCSKSVLLASVRYKWLESSVIKDITTTIIQYTLVYINRRTLAWWGIQCLETIEMCLRMESGDLSPVRPVERWPRSYGLTAQHSSPFACDCKGSSRQSGAHSSRSPWRSGFKAITSRRC